MPEEFVPIGAIRGVPVMRIENADRGTASYVDEEGKKVAKGQDELEPLTPKPEKVVEPEPEPEKRDESAYPSTAPRKESAVEAPSVVHEKKVELPATVAALVLQACYGPSGHATHQAGHEATLFHRQPSQEKVVRLSIKRDGHHERVWIDPPTSLTFPLTDPVEN